MLLHSILSFIFVYKCRYNRVNVTTHKLSDTNELFKNKTASDTWALVVQPNTSGRLAPINPESIVWTAGEVSGKIPEAS